MSYPRNAASPPPIAIGAIYLTADGTIQTTDALVRVKTGTGSWGTGAGTLACDTTSGVWVYTPTQGETNAESFFVAIYKAASTTAQITVVTSASATAGYGGLDWGKITDKTATVALTNTTVGLTTTAINAIGAAFLAYPLTKGTAGTIERALWQLAKTSYAIDATVLASPTPTTTTFRISGADYPTGAMEHSILWFDEGTANIELQNSPIATWTNNNDGTVTVVVEEPFEVAPQAGDTALVMPNTHVHSVAAIQAGLATLANQLLIKSVTDKLNTGLIADGQVFQFTANMLELTPGGGGAGSATVENQELILDEIDTLRSSFASAVGRLAIASQLVGFPPSIVRNSDYSTTTESEIRITLKDLDGAPITEIGGVPCDEIEWLFGIGSERSPALIPGAATWDNVNSQLVIQLAATDTAGKPTGTLSWQIGCTIDETTRYLGGGTTRLLERHF